MNKKAVFDRYLLAQEALTEALEAINKGKRELALDCFSAASSYANDAYKLVMDNLDTVEDLGGNVGSCSATGARNFSPDISRTKLAEVSGEAGSTPASPRLLNEQPKRSESEE